MPTYEQKYVCYIDILGFSSAISQPDHPHFDRSVGYFLNALGLLENIPNKPDYLLNGLEVSQLSDCVAFSCAVDPASLSLLFDRVAHPQRELLKGGLPSRGAITKGAIFHKNGYIFGPALVQAVEMEATADFPRVILSIDVLQDLSYDLASNNYSDKIACDPDGNRYVQYIENWACMGNTNDFYQLKETILLGLRTPSVEKKYKWLASKFNDRLDAKPLPNITKIIF